MSTRERATLVGGVLLVASLTLLPWHTGGPPPTPGGASGRTAIQAPGALLGVAGALAAAATVAWLALATLPPQPPVPHPGRAVPALAVAALGLAVVKLVTGVDDLAVGSWASLVLAASLVTLQLPTRRPVSAGGG